MKSQTATILIVDDEISNIEIMSAALEDAYEICFATSGEQALETARKIIPDLILLDVVMPGIQGFEVCSVLKADTVLADIPVIFTTGLGDSTDEVHGLSLGAIDYVTKPIQPAILRSRVKNHVELKRLRDDLAEMAVTDALTGLYNRRNFDTLLKQTLLRASRQGEWLSLIMLDIDFFKQFNDAYGHPSGDSCIIMVASALKRAMVKNSGFAARYGGEEFACVLPGVDHAKAMLVSSEIRDDIKDLAVPHARSAVSDVVTVSIGVASTLARADYRPEVLTLLADKRLYISKATGRDRICGDYLEQMTERETLKDMRRASS